MGDRGLPGVCRWLIAGGLTATVVGWTAGAAAGSTTSSLAAQRFEYRAAEGEANVVTLVVDGSVLRITDTGASALPESLDGCVEVPVEVGVGARCRAPGEVVVRIDLGDGDDHVVAFELPARVAIDVTMGEGRAIVEAGDGDDRIVGGPGDDDLYGGWGDDVVIGRGGFDFVSGNDGDDVVDGGEGGNFVAGHRGDDRLSGGSGIDFLFGGSGNDVIDGERGVDALWGDAGDDVLRGGGGDDDVRGGSGSDEMHGDAGADLMVANDGRQDVVDCGVGHDAAKVDAGGIDTIAASCEDVRRQK